MAKNVTLADIAKKLGVSTVTVSKGLRGKDGVSDELRAQIFQTAEALGYTAKEGTLGERYCIGILTASRYLQRGSSFYWSLYERLLNHLSDHGDLGLLEVVNAEEEAQCIVPRIVQDKRVQGLILMGNLSEDYIRMIQAQQIPFTFLDAYNLDMPYDSVISDGYFGMCKMTHYLIRRGHRKILFVGTVQETSSITDRYFGYCRAMEEAGLKVTGDMVIPDRDAEGKINTVIPPDIIERATALVCNCDFTAYQVFTKLTAMGIKVPEDISLVGFDNYILSEMSSVGITTYGIDQDGMAAASAEQIRRRIANPSAKQDFCTVRGELIERESVKYI